MKQDFTFFKEIDTPDKAYILGLIAADGSVKNEYVVRLALRDCTILESISQILYNGNNKVTQNKCDQMFVLNICSKQWVADLNQHGIVRNKTKFLQHTMTVKNSVYNNFVLGYFDGDGTIAKADKVYKVGILGTKLFLEGMLEKIHQLCGVKPKIYKVKKGISELYNLEISGSKKVKTFLKWLYNNADLKLDRKYQIAFNKLSSVTVSEAIDKCLEDFNKSQLSLKQYCELNNINLSTMKYRILKRKLKVT